jgi:hypothetical protein
LGECGSAFQKFFSSSCRSAHDMLKAKRAPIEYTLSSV